MLLYPVALLIIYFYHCEIATGDSFIPDFLGREQARMLQAVSCMFVVLHHLTQMISSYGDIYRGPITILSSMGILFTSVFFFYSGYGLIISVTNDRAYLDGFLRHRLSTILVPFFTANIIAVLIRIYYLNIPMTLKQVMQCVLGYVLLNGNGWFIVEIFFIYIAFYILFKTVKNTGVATALLCGFTVFLIYKGFKSGHDFTSIGDHWFKGEWWYNSTIVFIQGVLIAYFRDWIREHTLPFVKKYYAWVTSSIAGLFVIAFIFEEKIRKRYGYYRTWTVIKIIDTKLLTLISQMVLCVVFMTLVILIHMKVKAGNKALKWISTYTMEIFLIHGLFINYILNFNGKNEFVSFGLVIVCSLVAAVLVHIFNKRIIDTINRRAYRKEYLKDCEIDLISERREKIIKLCTRVVTIVAALLILASAVYYMVIIPRECDAELDVLKNANVHDTVLFGRYEIKPGIPGKERVEWIVVKKENGKIMLLAKEGLESSAYNSSHKEVDFTSSTVYELLNLYMYDAMFSSGEKKHIVENEDSTGYLSLMSVGEANEFFANDEDRQLMSTGYALKKGANVNTPSKINSWDYKDYRTSWWWLRGEKDITAPAVSPEGEILFAEKYVNRPNGAVRPIVWVNIE